jgi:hypothetical protein
MFFIWRLVGYATMPCRKLVHDAIHTYSGWAADLQKLEAE